MHFPTLFYFFTPQTVQIERAFKNILLHGYKMMLHITKNYENLRTTIFNVL